MQFLNITRNKEESSYFGIRDIGTVKNKWMMMNCIYFDYTLDLIISFNKVNCDSNYNWNNC